MNYRLSSLELKTISTEDLRLSTARQPVPATPPKDCKIPIQPSREITWTGESACRPHDQPHSGTGTTLLCSWSPPSEHHLSVTWVRLAIITWGPRLRTLYETKILS